MTAQLFEKPRFALGSGNRVLPFKELEENEETQTSRG
jgi:hypothetical protein